MKFMLVALLLISNVFAHEMRPFGFVTPKKYSLQKSLPPNIQLTYERPCNARFVKVIRHESLDPDTKEVTIALGVMVKIDKLSSCSGVSDETVDAGQAFSGRAHTIEFIEFAKAHTDQKSTVIEVDHIPSKAYGSDKGVSCPVDVVPGKRLGIMELGKKLPELTRPEMQIKRLGSSDVYVIGPYKARFTKAGNLESVSAFLGKLPHCVEYQGKGVNPGSSLKTLRLLFPDCKFEGAIGSTTYKCNGITLEHGTWLGSTVELTIL